MKNLLTYLILLIVGGLICFYGFKKYAFGVKDKHCFSSQVSSKIFDFNSFELSVPEDLNIKDFIVVNRNSGNIIFNNGENLNGIKNEYGHCTFELIYQNKKNL